MMKTNSNPRDMERKNRSVRLQIFMSPSCCPGGVCGPGFGDPTSQLITVVQELMVKYNGQVSGEVINVLHPLVRAHHQDVIKRVRERGILALPILKIDGTIIAEGANFSKELIINAVRERLQA
jgi:disulfide oxidoreductase YuzD